MPVAQGEIISNIQSQLRSGNTGLADVACKCGKSGTLRHAKITSEEGGKIIKTEIVHCCSCTTQYVMPEN